ncbi:MAG: oxygenase MpaB family protein [Ginsengibacter sp.]
MEYFVDKDSVVRKIWGKSDTVLFVFAGASAEFALNKAVDWLYYTGKLPADPLKRLFSTITYARKIVFSEKEDALKTIDRISAIHSEIEINRGARIPDWAYRDVLFMLIHYSIASFELMETKLTEDEKEDVYNVFLRLGSRMRLRDLPQNYNQWVIVRARHLQDDLEKSHYTIDLYKQYKKHLGIFRYAILLESQILVVPPRVNELLGLGKISWLTPLLMIYKLSRIIKLDGWFKSIILPTEYIKEIKELDVIPE